MKSRGKYQPVLVLVWAVLIIAGLCAVLPYAWMLTTSFKSTPEIMKDPLHFFPRKFDTSGYTQVLKGSPFLYWLRNSVVTTLGSTLLVLFTSSIIGMVFAKYQFRGNKILFWTVLSFMMVPFMVTVLPSYLLFTALGLKNSLWAIVIPTVVSPFGIFLMKQSIEDIPDSVLEAASIDGATSFLIYYRIVLPQVKPAIAALAIFNFLSVWNDYFWPLLILDDSEKMTVPVALTFFNSQHVSNYNVVMSAAALIMIPVLIFYLIFQRQFIKGVSLTGMK